MKKVTLFVDVDNLHQQLRSLHHRSLDPALLVETARQAGEVASAVGVADWTDLPPELATACEAAGISRVQVERAARSRETGGRRRDFVRDLVDLELLAQVIEHLFGDGRPEVGLFVLATCDDAAARIVSLVRDRFQKDVVVLGVEGGVGPRLQAAATRVEHLPMPAMEPREPELLARLVPLLEGLEKKKRYLNFKYIRETIVRRLDLPERSFDAAERLLSEAITCGLLLKLKVEDKYNPGQLFTAYALNRESEWFKKWGSGEPAPLHLEGEGPASEGGPERAAEGVPVDTAPGYTAAEDHPAPPAPAPGRAAPSFGTPRPEPRRAPERPRPPEPRIASPPPPGPDEEELEDEEPRDRPDAARDRDGGRGNKRRRRRRGGEGGGRGGPPEPPQIPLSAGSAGRRGGRNPQLDRVGRAYEAPSRFIQDEGNRPAPEDEDIDEDRILRARGD